MKILGKKKIADFIEKYTDSGAWLRAWLAEAEEAKWETPQDVKSRYGSASFLKDNLVVFNVKGNNYRMEVQIAYETGVAAIKRIGTHSEYAKWPH